MGRIADALRKAERERAEKVRLGVTRSSGATAVINASPRAERSTIDAKSRIRSASSVAERFGPPPGFYSDGTTPSGEGASLIGHRRRAAGIDAMPHWNAPPTLVAAHDRTSTITEQYRAARTWLLSRKAVGDANCIAVTSSVPHEGKTITVANLAVVMAEVRHLNVLAVDCDLRQGALARMFKLPNAPGLADVVTGRVTLQEAIAATPLKNLHFLPAGTCQDLGPAELLNSSATAVAFEAIRERYNFVLVDTPAVQKLSDAGVVGSLCSGLVMVVRMHQTGSNIVRQSVERLKANNLNVIGCLATGCNPRDTRFDYSDGDEVPS